MAPVQITFTTSQLADAAKVGSQTLRYYERRGLLPEPPRTEGGHRIYGRKHLERLRFIQDIQTLGFHLEEIHALLEVNETPPVGAQAPEVLDSFIDRIDEKAQTLAQMRATLADLRTRATSELRDQS
ncbi:MAG: MerR family transcriptional regulator [Longimicrobiales bacterium]|nr:MerR family transcriptional regulator [Longimicrobiales bacterium]